LGVAASTHYILVAFSAFDRWVLLYRYCSERYQRPPPSGLHFKLEFRHIIYVHRRDPRLNDQNDHDYFFKDSSTFFLLVRLYAYAVLMLDLCQLVI
jgi:hypothetical protein